MSTSNTAADSPEHETSACFDEAAAKSWHEKLLAEVDYHCSFCEGLRLEIAELEAKVRDAFAATARSMKGLYEQKEIANRWAATWLFAVELLAVARASSELHQICGADVSGIEQYVDAARERFQLHCSQEVYAVA